MNLLSKILAVVSVVLLTSCATTEPELRGRPKERLVYGSQQTEEMGSYLRLFAAEAQKRGITLNYTGLRVYMVDRFADVLQDQGVIGLCTFSSDKQVVYVSKPDWDSYDSLQREMLIFHELGHCILMLEHDESTDGVGDPVDMMYPANFESHLYFFDRAGYLNRLFQKVVDRQNAMQQREESGQEPESVEMKKIHTCKWKKVTKAQKKLPHGNPKKN